MKGKSKRKPGGKRAKGSKKKPKSKGKEKQPSPGKPPLEVVRHEQPPAEVAPDQPPNGNQAKPSHSESEIRPLNPVDALQYKFALLQEKLVVEKKKNIELKKEMIRKDEEILALRSEVVVLKETVVTREEDDLCNTSAALLKRLGVGENEEVMLNDGRLFVAPKGTAQKMQNG